MEDKTVNLLKKTFSEYYKRNKSRISEPSRFTEREFGYWPFDGFMQRHMAVVKFSTFIDELILNLIYIYELQIKCLQKIL